MDVEKYKYETPKQQPAGEPGSDRTHAQRILERRAEVRGPAEQAASDVSDKTARAVSDTYKQAKSYSRKNPGKTILIAFGIGAGLGFLLGANSRRSRTGRFAKPVVNALSDIALELFR